MRRLAVGLGLVLAGLLVATIWYQAQVIEKQRDLIEGITQNPCGFTFVWKEQYENQYK